jgi:hypothetical protein
MKTTDITLRQLPDSILDLSKSGMTTITLNGSLSSEIILPEEAEHVDVSDSPQLRRLVLPRGVKVANVSNCPSLGGNLVVLGLLERLILCDREKLSAHIRGEFEGAV